MASKNSGNGNGGGASYVDTGIDDYPTYLNTTSDSFMNKYDELREEYDIDVPSEQEMIQSNISQLQEQLNRNNSELRNLINQTTTTTDTNKLEDYRSDESELRADNANLDHAIQLQKQQIKLIERMENIMQTISQGVTPQREEQLRNQLNTLQNQRTQLINDLNDTGKPYW